MVNTSGVSRNRTLIRGVSELSRSAMFYKTKRWSRKPSGKTANATPVTAPEVTTSRYYRGDDVATPVYSTKRKARMTRLRPSVQPGSVLILLAGRFKGKRVVCLKQLSSGLLLVSGPFQLNGVPLRRVNQAYVIGTSTKLDLPKDVAADIDDAFFKKDEKKDKKKSDDEFFTTEKAAKELKPERKAMQAKVDAKIMSVIEDDMVRSYLKTRFTLSRGQHPHDLKF